MTVAPAADRQTRTIALIGNPNTGKSTLFSALAGVHQKVGNYPGVTVEKKIGRMMHQGVHWALVDLPGTYSLAPRSPDEMVAVDVLSGRRADVNPPDAVLCIVDASNLERNLYLVSQVLDLGLPTVVALNMVDVARARGLVIDAAMLSERLGVPVVEVQANRRLGLDRLKMALAEALARPAPEPISPFPEPFPQEVERLRVALAESGRGTLPRHLIERLLLDTTGYVERHVLPDEPGALHEAVRAARERLAQAGCPVPAVEAMARYGWVARVLDGVVRRPERRPITAADRLDRVLTHRLWGTLIFAALMLVVFQAIFRWSEGPIAWIDQAIGSVGDWVGSHLAEGPLRSLLVDGIIGGVGSVLAFLPQILFLFFFIAILEDCGYMARAAYLMDKLMVRLGLSGKSFIPLLSSFACAIPGVMATRVIENRRDRLTTILIAPLMSCSARLPVYTLLIAAFIPDRRYLGGLLGLRALTMFAMYLVGILTAAGVAFLLKRTLLRGATPPFVMELPAYKWPSPRLVLHRMLDRGWAFVRRAGTMILAVSVLVWAAAYFPHDSARVEAPYRSESQALEIRLAALPPDDPARFEVEARKAELEAKIAGAYRRQSWLGRAGRFLEPAVRPLGWDWRIGCAAIASFPAREVVIATLGVLFDVGDQVEEGEANSRLQDALRAATWEGTDRPLFNVPVALSLMVFFALCAQCVATLAVIRRETNSWVWPLFTFTYMTTLAYLAALVTYQVGMLLSA
ncbi:MAG: ferrous iron transport protein B [Isosphaeraceae bacterium]|nr:ferrous iron transport protein B [Isosphaeraceae bacterium]